MIMVGTIVNCCSIIIGSGIGALIGNRLPERIRSSIFIGLGIAVLVIGFTAADDSVGAGGSLVLLVLNMAAGSAVGSALELDHNLSSLT